MIIFYDKKTRKIVGFIAGRLHDDHVLKNTWVGEKKNSEKYVVPYTKVGDEHLPDVPFADTINDFESGEKNPHDYLVELKGNLVVGFEKQPDN